MNHDQRIKQLLSIGYVIYSPGSGVDATPLHGELVPDEDSFNQAVRTYFGAPPGATVSVEIHGRQDYQIGDYTWDTEPERIEVSVVWWIDDGTSVLPESKQISFDSLPALWADLT